MKSVVSELCDRMGKAFKCCRPSEAKGHLNSFSAMFA